MFIRFGELTSNYMLKFPVSFLQATYSLTSLTFNFSIYTKRGVMVLFLSNLVSSLNIKLRKSTQVGDG